MSLKEARIQLYQSFQHYSSCITNGSKLLLSLKHHCYLRNITECDKILQLLIQLLHKFEFVISNLNKIRGRHIVIRDIMDCACLDGKFRWDRINELPNIIVQRDIDGVSRVNVEWTNSYNYSLMECKMSLFDKLCR